MNRGPKPKRRLQAALSALLFVGVMTGGLVAARQYFQDETNISAPPPAVVSKVLAAESNVKTVSAGVATLSLPKDWEPYTSPEVPTTAYGWRNTGKEKGIRRIIVYVDAMPPTTMALNRVLAVEADGERMQQVGSVSENCVDFVEGGRNPASSTGTVSARWDGVQFMCDIANYSRNVAGVASAGSVNGVTLNGPSGAHKVFVTFTDSSVTPKYDIFSTAVESLRVR